ncbi:MAG: hypothetical protein CMF22_10265 [Idiomarinaceae bacterium]|nr:hypothetical protein [Idiomarinaceae bacterium]MBG23826.1 hypothetical protein [Idiomarinaceae bacterium]
MIKIMLEILFRVFLLISTPFALMEIFVYAVIAFFKEFRYRVVIEYRFLRDHMKYGIWADEKLRKKYLEEVKKYGGEE